MALFGNDIDSTIGNLHWKYIHLFFNKLLALYGFVHLFWFISTCYLIRSGRDCGWFSNNEDTFFILINLIEVWSWQSQWLLVVHRWFMFIILLSFFCYISKHETRTEFYLPFICSNTSLMQTNISYCKYNIIELVL